MREKDSIDSAECVREGVRRARNENRPLRILYVCLGNICRSPAAEGIMRELAAEEKVDLELDSAGFYGGHAGELPDRRMREAAYARGLRLDHRSRTVRPSDFDYFDIIIGMDDNNIASLRNAAPTFEVERKIVRMADFALDHPEADYIPDPYWEGRAGFIHVLDLLEDANSHLLEIIKIDNQL